MIPRVYWSVLGGLLAVTLVLGSLTLAYARLQQARPPPRAQVAVTLPTATPTLTGLGSFVDTPQSAPTLILAVVSTPTPTDTPRAVLVSVAPTWTPPASLLPVTACPTGETRWLSQCVNPRDLYRY